MLGIILFITFVTVVFISSVVLPGVATKLNIYNKQRERELSARISSIVSQEEAARIVKILIIAPFFSGVLFYLLLPSEIKIIGLFAGAFLGLVLPLFYIKILKRKIQRNFLDQLVDALMIMSSSFRGGLSLIQAIEAVVEEMPNPIQREFGIVLGENKMGVPLDEAFNHLYKRMPSTALQQMNTAILLSRETGGNLPIIFSKIITNIRESKKIQQNIDTLTIQGRIQGVVLTLLPVAFSFVVYSSNRRIFDNMISSDLGKKLLIVAFFLWIIGAFFIIKISTFKDY